MLLESFDLGRVQTPRDASAFLLAIPVTEAIEAGHMAGWLPHLATL